MFKSLLIIVIVFALLAVYNSFNTYMSGIYKYLRKIDRKLEEMEEDEQSNRRGS